MDKLLYQNIILGVQYQHSGGVHLPVEGGAAGGAGGGGEDSVCISGGRFSLSKGGWE